MGIIYDLVIVNIWSVLFVNFFCIFFCVLGEIGYDSDGEDFGKCVWKD